MSKLCIKCTRQNGMRIIKKIFIKHWVIDFTGANSTIFIIEANSNNKPQSAPAKRPHFVKVATGIVKP